MKVRATTSISLLALAIACPASGQTFTDGIKPAAVEGTGQAPADKVPQAAPPATRSGVEDVIVTAQRRSERLQNVPIAVTAVTAARLQTAGISNTQDLSVVTPGLIVPQAAGYTQPHIRGVGSSSNGPGIEQPVATYVDGVYIAAAPAALLTLNNVDRIEVLKGPQGTLFGRNSTGGLIQVITRDPKQTASAAFNITYANYRDVTSDAYVSGGLAKDLAADVAVRYEHQGKGWGRNLGTGRATENLPHDFAARTKLLYNPSAATQVRVSLDYEDRIDRRNAQHASLQYPATFNNPLFGGPYALGGAYDINSELDPEDRLKAGGASLQINQELGNHVAVQSITAYRQSEFNFLLDTDLTPVQIVSVDATAKGSQFSQELQFSSRDLDKLTWVAGLFYFKANDRWDTANVNFGPTIVSPVPFSPVVLKTDDRQRTDSFAGYAQGTYEVFDATKLTLGGRYTYERKRADGFADFLVSGFSAGRTPVPDPAIGIADRLSFKRFNYRIALDHKFGRNVLAYASYNTGFKSGGYNLSVPSNAPYRPEGIQAAEVGLKTELFDRRVRLNGSAYHYYYKNIQVGRYIDSNVAIYNGARAGIHGFDIDGEWVVGGGLSLDGGFSYNVAKFRSFPLADYVVPIAGCTPPPGGVCSGSAKGKDLPFSPRTSFNVAGTYKIATSRGDFVLTGTYYGTSHFFSNPDNVGRQDAYDLVNASGTWISPSDGISVRIWAKNIGKTVYATSLIEATQGLVRSLGAPRTYGMTLGFKY